MVLEIGYQRTPALGLAMMIRLGYAARQEVDVELLLFTDLHACFLLSLTLCLSLIIPYAS